jgi:hypothetical protein
MTRTLEGSPVRCSSRPLRDTSRDWDWVNEHADQYRGQWVMVYEGRLVAAEANIRQVLSKVPRGMYPDSMLTYIPTAEEAERVVL